MSDNTKVSGKSVDFKWRKKPNNRNGKGRKNTNASKSSAYSKDDLGKLLPCDNDVSWYSKDQSLLRSVGTFQWYNPLGMEVDINNEPDDITIKNSTITVPGIMTLYYDTALTTGMADYSDSKFVASKTNTAVQLAINKLYSYVRHANSGHSNYDAPDLMAYLMAVGELHALHAWFKRLYGIVQTYSPTNRYLPRRLVESMGVQWNTVFGKTTELLAYINNAAALINQLYIPSTFDYITRHIWMNSHIYVDSQTSKAQIYLFNPYHTRKFIEADSQGIVGVKLEPFAWITEVGTDYKGTLLTLSNYESKMTELIEAVVSSETCGVMSGDILKAFGATGILQCAGIDFSYSVVPEYSEEVLTQFENAYITGDPTMNSITYTSSAGTQTLNSGTIFVSPTNNGLIQNAVITQSYPHACVSYPLNMHVNEPTPEQVMVATRLMGNVYYDHAASSSGKLISYVNRCTTEIVTMMAIHYMDTSLFYKENGFWQGGERNTITAFDHFPTSYNFTGSWDSGYTLSSVICNWDVFRLMTSQELLRLNEVAFYGLWALPQPIQSK